MSEVNLVTFFPIGHPSRRNEEKSKGNKNQYHKTNTGSEEHGFIDAVKCDYLLYDFPKTRPISQEVKILIYKGQVTRVFCKFFKQGKCESPDCEDEDKNCYIKLP